MPLFFRIFFLSVLLAVSAGAGAQPSAAPKGGIPLEKRIWRQIDLKENQATPFACSGRPLLEVLKAAAQSRKVPMYGPNDHQKKRRFVDSISVAQLSAILTLEDTLFRLDDWGNPVVDDPRTTAREDIYTVPYEMRPERLHWLLIEEVWTLDAATQKWSIRLESIVPLLDKRSRRTDEVVALVPLFTMPYAPLRQYLLQYDTPRTTDVVDVFSWADFFDMRLYQGKIVQRK
jgi:hypothetical protein